jgi:hypothetical protein
VIADVPASEWEQGLGELFLQIGHRFSRVEPRRRIRDYVRGLLGSVGRKNSWQLADFAGHSTPDGLQHLLAKSRWEADEVRDDLQGYVGEALSRCWVCGCLMVYRGVVGRGVDLGSGCCGLGSGAGAVVPDGEADGHFGSLVGGGHQMAAGPEVR